MGFVNLSYFLGRLNPFENDPTPRIEDEDFDLFLANTAGSHERRNFFSWVSR